MGTGNFVAWREMPETGYTQLKRCQKIFIVMTQALLISTYQDLLLKLKDKINSKVYSPQIIQQLQCGAHATMHAKNSTWVP